MCDGYDVQRNVQRILKVHTKTGNHVFTISMYLNRTKLSGKIDSQLQKELFGTQNYWKNVLKCLNETILFLSKCGLPFRGSDEHCGSKNNENYLRILQLISKFDPF